MKKILIIILIILSLILVGCNDKEDTGIRIALLKGPTGMGAVKLLKNDDMDFKVEANVFQSPDEVVAKIINEEVDIAMLPTNLAAILNKKTKGNLKLLAVNTINTMYLLSGEDIKSLNGLEGKTIFSAGKGGTPQFVLEHILKENSLLDKVKVEYLNDHSSVAGKATEKSNILLLPQPFAQITSMKNKDYKIVIDLGQEWKDITGLDLMMGAVVVNKKFADENKSLVSKFLKEYENSIKWVNENPEEASKIIEEKGIFPKAKVAEKAIPKSGIKFIESNEAKEGLNAFYKVLFDNNPKSIGGELPGPEFYYEP